MNPPLPVERSFRAGLDGSQQRYVEIRPQTLPSGKACDLLLALHGHGSDRWQFALHARDECRASRDFAARHGMVLVSPDYRAPASWMGPAAEADLVDLIALLRGEFRVRRLFWVGGSMGGTAALIFAALHPELADGVCAMNGTAHMLEFQNDAQGISAAIAASYGGRKEDCPGEYRRRSPELVPERLRMPVALTVGGLDRVVPPESLRRLAGILLAGGRSDVLLIDRPDGGHATDFEDATRALEFMFEAAGSREARG